jgi:hypothetical protein
VGERLFPVAIRARAQAARVDWRRDYDSLNYEGIEVPEDVAAGLRAYLTATGWRSPRLTCPRLRPVSTTSWS